MVKALVKTLLVLMLWPFVAGAAPGMLDAPIEWNGDLGYSLRILSGDSSGDATSQQLRGSINAKTWLWEPWLATVDLGLRGTWDTTDYDNSGLSSSNTASIITGDLDLGVLPRSRTPFQLSYRVSDTRVDAIDIENPLTTLGGREFRTSRLSMKQSYFTSNGQRFQARYDNNRWKSNVDNYADWLLGGEMSLKLPKQTLQAKVSYQDREASVLNQNTQTTIINVDHFYYPSRALRIDSMASLYDSDKTSEQPLNSTNQADSNTDLTQLSSFVFWRPENRPLSISGGVRLYDLGSSTTGNDISVNNLSTTAGLLYQYTKNIRFDANIDHAVVDTDGQQVTSNSERGGILYQSDLHEIFDDFSYQYFASYAFQLREADNIDSQGQSVSLGHDAQRVWLNDRFTSWRLSLSQTWNGNQQTTNDIDTDTQQLNHSASLAWDSSDESASTSVQFTLSDARQSGDSENNQQFANFQAHRTQYLDRRSSLSGNLTVQTVRQDFNGQGNNDTVTTATGQVNYRHSRVMGVPNLSFLSDLRVSRAATDEGVDRGEWENRLDYIIGMLDTRFSWRYTELNNERFSLLYLQVTRRF